MIAILKYFIAMLIGFIIGAVVLSYYSAVKIGAEFEQLEYTNSLAQLNHIRAKVVTNLEINEGGVGLGQLFMGSLCEELFTLAEDIEQNVTRGAQPQGLDILSYLDLVKKNYFSLARDLNVRCEKT